MGIELQLMLPVALISALSIIGIVIDAFSGSNKNIIFGYSVTVLIAVATAAAFTINMPIEGFVIEESITYGMISFGGMAAYFDILFCLGGLLTIFAARPYLRRENAEYREFYTILLLSIAGMIIIAHAANLLILFIGIEIMSISFYILAGYFRSHIRSIEAALKYFLLGAFATGFLVYGIAMVYGATGSLDLSEISFKISTGNFETIYLTIGVGLLTIGLFFKVAAFPFHQWAPDVYEGAPTVVTAFMSTAGKAAAMAAFIVVSRSVIPSSNIGDLINFDPESVRMVIAVVAALTMLIGNITAVVQKNVKRMLSYSSVAHAGYMLMGIAAASSAGYSAIVFYASAYLFMQIGAFVILSLIEKEKDGYLQLDDYAGLSRSKPVLAALMALFMFSLAGIPPMAGFFGKYYLFVAAIESGMTWLTIIAVISSIISVYFYIGLVVYMYFKPASGETEYSHAKGGALTLALSAAGILIFGIFPSLIMDLAGNFF